MLDTMGHDVLHLGRCFVVSKGKEGGGGRLARFRTQPTTDMADVKFAACSKFESPERFCSQEHGGPRRSNHPSHVAHPSPWCAPSTKLWGVAV